VFLSGQTQDLKENYGRATLEQYEKYLGLYPFSEDDDSERVRGRRLSVDIYWELRNRIGAGVIRPVRTAYQLNGELDIRDTRIRTHDVVKLARDRGEQPEYLVGFMRDPKIAAETALHNFLAGQKGEPVLTKEALFEAINTCGHQLFESCGNGKLRLKSRAFTRAWNAAPEEWHKPGRRTGIKRITAPS
jgi:hypothetical protein